ncbi:MAG: hypothetical protein ACTS1Z_04635 [Parasphingopyxis sp.]|uniref:hypothetical protein n=1 Tax=Parasphingopyxis sp. TaxID=1920299 RepID=UPI003FA02147
MTRAAKAGTFYFLCVFAAGFVLGTIRVLMLVPAIGEWPANLIELPIILTVCWLACGWAIRRYAVDPAVAPRATMGAIAFGLLMLAELALATLLLGESIGEYGARLIAPLGLLGLAGQFCFALFPLWRLR